MMSAVESPEVLARVTSSNSFELSNPNANPRSLQLLRIFNYLAVPSSLVSCYKYLLLPLCHGRGELWRSRVDGSEALQLSARPLFASSPQWSPDGCQIAFSGIVAGEDWQLYVASTNGDTPPPLPQSTGGLDPSWLRDGTTLMYGIFRFGSGSEIRALDLRKRERYRRRHGNLCSALGGS